MSPMKQWAHGHHKCIKKIFGDDGILLDLESEQTCGA